MEGSKAAAITAKHRERLRDRYRLPITVQQRETQRDPGHAGFPLWTSHVVLPKPAGSSVLQSLLQVIRCLGDGRETFSVPDVRSVEGEWLGWRRRRVENDDLKKMPEKAKFDNMMKDTTNRLTILFIHGGAFYLGNPATSRPVLANLVKGTSGRALAVRYRLSPQHPFPAPLVDIIVAYLSLLYPPPGSFHDPVPADSIVFVGESSGANLCLAVLQFILELGRQQCTSVPKVVFHGKEVALPVPAGLASVCGMLDMTRSLPSWTREDDYDLYGAGPGPYLLPDFPKDEIWPTRPPRGEMYCEVSALCHPLASPTAAVDWTGSPPMFICCGEERAADSNAVVARRASDQEVRIVWEQFEAMPHLFFLLMANTPNGKVLYEDWAAFCSDCVYGGQDQNGTNVLVEVKTLKKRQVDLKNLASISYEGALRLMKARRDAGGVSTIKAKF